MILNKKTIGALTPDSVRALQPNEVLAAVLYTRTQDQLTGVPLMNKEAYSTATKRVGSHFHKKEDGGLLKIDAYKAAPEGIQTLAKSYRAAIDQRKLAEKIIAAVPFLKEDKTGKNLPKELKGVATLTDTVKGGLKPEVYAEMKNFPGFADAVKTLRSTPAKKTAPARMAEPSM